MMLKIFVFCVLSLSACVALAGSPPFMGCGSLGCIGQIDNVYLNPNGTIQVPPPAGVDTAGLACTLGDGMYLTIKSSNPHFERTYAMLLTAHASKKNVYLRTVTSSPDCEVFYSVIY